MNNEAKLGTIPKGDEGRDAIHVAIIPIKAAAGLSPGQHVGIDRNGNANCFANPLVGIVDPFLKDPISKGDWFWLCLYQKTVTGMRHCWSHPAFPNETLAKPTIENTAKQISEEWIRVYVRKHCPYDNDELDGGYRNFINRVTRDREIFYHGNDCHSLGDVEDADELFRHLSVVLDRHIDSSYFEAFTCSC